MLTFNKYRKYDEKPTIIYAYLETFIEKIDGCKNNFEKSSTTKPGEHFHAVFQCLYYVHLMVYIYIKHDV